MYPELLVHEIGELLGLSAAQVLVLLRWLSPAPPPQPLPKGPDLVPRPSPGSGPVPIPYPNIATSDGALGAAGMTLSSDHDVFAAAVEAIRLAAGGRAAAAQARLLLLRIKVAVNNDPVRRVALTQRLGNLLQYSGH